MDLGPGSTPAAANASTMAARTPSRLSAAWGVAAAAVRAACRGRSPPWRRQRSASRAARTCRRAARRCRQERPSILMQAATAEHARRRTSAPPTGCAFRQCRNASSVAPRRSDADPPRCATQAMRVRHSRGVRSTRGDRQAPRSVSRVRVLRSRSVAAREGIGAPEVQSWSSARRTPAELPALAFALASAIHGRGSPGERRSAFQAVCHAAENRLCLPRASMAAAATWPRMAGGTHPGAMLGASGPPVLSSTGGVSSSSPASGSKRGLYSRLSSSSGLWQSRRSSAASGAGRVTLRPRCQFA
mmetsp:Transcript_34108/g.80914  ORF Transcript_34108/g.80914 Transcript_34108/m.80914 type:complete len:302 (+) Transcript_34108:205-1110(+)